MQPPGVLSEHPRLRTKPTLSYRLLHCPPPLALAESTFAITALKAPPIRSSGIGAIKRSPPTLHYVKIDLHRPALHQNRHISPATALHVQIS